MERVLVQLQLIVFAVVTSTILVSIIGMQCVRTESCVTEDLFMHCGSMIIDVS